MKVALKKSKPVSQTDIAAFEKATDVELPEGYRDFLLKFNGAEPESNRFTISGNNGSSVSRFIPLSEVLDAKKHIDNVTCGFLPVARDSCGNYVCISLDAGGEVFFWDHEKPSSNLKLASGFNAFLLMLEPFEASQIELKPEQVESVWIDPEFLKQQEDEGNLA